MRKETHSWGVCPLCGNRRYKLVSVETDEDSYVIDLCRQCLEEMVLPRFADNVTLLTAAVSLINHVVKRLRKLMSLGGKRMPSPIYVMADDGMLYKNPLIAGVVDDGLVEFFVCFTATHPPEVVVEVIQNYRPHRGSSSKHLWDWYERAAKTILSQMKLPFATLRRAIVCARMFRGENLKGSRSARAFSFFFDLVEPIPHERISKHEGVIPHTQDMQRPEGAYAWVVEDADERHAKVQERVEELRAEGILNTREPPSFRDVTAEDPPEPPEHPPTTPEEFEARHDEIAGPDKHDNGFQHPNKHGGPHTDRDS